MSKHGGSVSVSVEADGGEDLQLIVKRSRRLLRTGIVGGPTTREPCKYSNNCETGSCSLDPNNQA